MAQAQEKAVLFLCTGNYYRSRFAECLFNSVAGKMGLLWAATSGAWRWNEESTTSGRLRKQRPMCYKPSASGVTY